MTKQQQENQSSQQMTTPEIHLPVGTHLIVELYGCSEFRFSRKNLEQMAQACGAKSLAYASHQFQPQGQSGALLLEERDRKSVVVGKECRSRWSPYH